MSLSSATPPPRQILLRNQIPGSGNWTSDVIGQPPAGTRWRLISARVVADIQVPSPRTQHIFLWSEFLPQPGLPSPNQDFYARVRVEPGKTGHFESAGGYGPGAPGEFHHTAWAAPITLVYGLGVKFDSDVLVGNRASYEIAFQEEGPADAALLFHYSYLQDGRPQTVVVGSPPSGQHWRLECATVSLRVTSGVGPRTARLVRRPDGAVLAELTKFVPTPGRSSDMAATGGYSTEQTGPSAGGQGSQTVWRSPIFISTGETLVAELLGPAGDKGHYAVAVSRLPGPTPQSGE